MSEEFPKENNEDEEGGQQGDYNEDGYYEGGNDEVDTDYLFEYGEDEEIFCEVCQCSMSGPKAFESHLAGQRHKKNVRNQEMGAPVRRKGAHIPDIAYKNGKLVDWTPKCQKMIDNCKEALLGLECITEWCHRNRAVEPRYKCLLCSAKCDVRMLVSHMTGVKHRLAYMKRYYPEQAEKVKQEKRKIEQAPIAEEAAHEIIKRYGKKRMKVMAEGFDGHRDETKEELPPPVIRIITDGQTFLQQPGSDRKIDGTSFSGRMSSRDFDPRMSSRDFDPRMSSRDFDPRMSSRDFDPRMSSRDFDPRMSSRDFDPRMSSNQLSDRYSDDSRRHSPPNSRLFSNEGAFRQSFERDDNRNGRSVVGLGQSRGPASLMDLRTGPSETMGRSLGPVLTMGRSMESFSGRLPEDITKKPFYELDFHSGDGPGVPKRRRFTEEKFNDVSRTAPNRSLDSRPFNDEGAQPLFGRGRGDRPSLLSYPIDNGNIPRLGRNFDGPLGRSGFPREVQPSVGSREGPVRFQQGVSLDVRSGPSQQNFESFFDPFGARGRGESTGYEISGSARRPVVPRGGDLTNIVDMVTNLIHTERDSELMSEALADVIVAYESKRSVGFRPNSRNDSY